MVLDFIMRLMTKVVNQHPIKDATTGVVFIRKYLFASSESGAGVRLIKIAKEKDVNFESGPPTRFQTSLPAAIYSRSIRPLGLLNPM